MSFESGTAVVFMIALIVVVISWLVTNASERRAQRRAAEAEAAAHQERVESIEQLGQQLLDRYGPLTEVELNGLWKMILGSLAVSDSVTLSDLDAYVPFVRRLTKAAADAEVAPQGSGPEGTS